MSSVVDICNLALAHLGDDATVADIDPPEGSAQAEHCARFYPIARDALLEMHDWRFATRRVTLAQLDASAWAWTWRYAYTTPADALKLLAILPPDAPTDQDTSLFEVEANDDGTPLILTDTPDATLRYIAHVTDTTKFSPLFVSTLAWYLASMLAGPVLKGDVGAAEGQRCLQVMQAFLSKAAVSDSNQRRVLPEQRVGWITARR
jgi:hypothetical protein